VGGKGRSNLNIQQIRQSNKIWEDPSGIWKSKVHKPKKPAITKAREGARRGLKERNRKGRHVAEGKGHGDPERNLNQREEQRKQRIMLMLLVDLLDFLPHLSPELPFKLLDFF